MQINPSNPLAMPLIMRWPGRAPQPVYVTSLLQHLHLPPISALEVVTALADNLAGRSSVLEMQVEGWDSIDDLPPAPAHRQQLVNPPPPVPHPSPKTSPGPKQTPTPWAKRNPQTKQMPTQNLKPLPNPPPPKKEEEASGRVVLGALLRVLNGLLLLLLLLPYLQLLRLFCGLARA